MSQKKIHLISLGCAKALVDSEVLLGGLGELDIQSIDKPEAADAIVVNTCGFLEEARQESVDTILEAAELKKSDPSKQLLVMGCLPSRFATEELEEALPEVDKFFEQGKMAEVVQYLSGKPYMEFDPTYWRSLLTPNHYAYLKITEGCDNGCSFCSIPIMRGKQQSRTIPSLMKEAERLVSNGVKEIMIIGQDTTSYGWDLDEKVYLHDLMRELSTIEDLEWIRLHYAHPAHFSRKNIPVMADAENICAYLDMPVQHGSSRLLKHMRRGLDREGILKRIRMVREAIPNLALRTSLIVGYPTETEEDFRELYEFVQEVEFDRLGVFTYSHEPGTIAHDFEDDVPEQVKYDRKDEIMLMQQDIMLKKNHRHVDTTMKVLIDEYDRVQNEFVGRTEYDSPDVDGIVRIPAQSGDADIGEFYNVSITDANEYELFGTIESSCFESGAVEKKRAQQVTV
ncbi:MAG: 30S ribosomal protein S12 methylthiotransferase RimO [Candidatus Marinimicrobia bacterium]|nr:30S ribosomal protein S12 methylthiotransferase RimO [Candidatus Neomarinimicrobiota bacterium]MCF7830050.1 30S ribosomal protein S12 methylthiotransferase RimO [Candidatus Neomarinimicrobiota bacterium]MCF7882351.1 30S ribosomal protein S12 methylthiotransferase RimO [Candidatus Neomarinimicrobiota bacterium]